MLNNSFKPKWSSQKKYNSYKFSLKLFYCASAILIAKPAITLLLPANLFNPLEYSALSRLGVKGLNAMGGFFYTSSSMLMIYLAYNMAKFSLSAQLLSTEHPEQTPSENFQNAFVQSLYISPRLGLVSSAFLVPLLFFPSILPKYDVLYSYIAPIYAVFLTLDITSEYLKSNDFYKNAWFHRAIRFSQCAVMAICYAARISQTSFNLQVSPIIEIAIPLLMVTFLKLSDDHVESHIARPLY